MAITPVHPSSKIKKTLKKILRKRDSNGILTNTKPRKVVSFAIEKPIARLSVKQKKTKEVKDPNKPKRPPSAFFVFMEGFRKQFKEKNPASKRVAAMGKAGAKRWRSMSDEDKAEFVTIAEQRKKEYEKKMKAYENKQAGENEEDESDKSKSEVNDEASEEEEDDD